MAELSNELKEIKKKYGETFMHICRDNFSTLLETEGLLSQILDKYFATNSKSIGEDIIKNEALIGFKDFVYSKIDVEKEETPIIIGDKTPYQILDEAGYELIECKTEREIQKFRKYYDPKEVICTISNGGRLNSCVVFFAVKKDAENIQREEKPKREDEYGRSVLGIQFDKHGTCTPHIISRYNHTVNNPNATYGNDLDEIASGLTDSFARLLQERGLKLKKVNIEKFEMPGYTVASDGKYYKYNMEVNGVYYCPGNIIIKNGEVKKLEKPESQILIDYFILDVKEKSLKLYDNSLRDSFLDGFENIEKIEIEKGKDKEKQTRIITIQIKDSNIPIRIEIDNNNNIVGYENKELTEVGDNFLFWNKQLSKLISPKLTKVGDNCLQYNEQLSELNLPELIEVGDYCLLANRKLSELYFPKLTKVGKFFLCFNKQLSRLNLLELIEVGDDCLHYNEQLSELNVPKLKNVGDNFNVCNKQLSELYLPKLKKAGNNFLFNNEKLSSLYSPRLTEKGDEFLALHPSRRKLIANMHKKNKKNNATTYINPKEIAELDRNTGLTTTEVNLGRKIIEKLKEIFQR